MDEVAVILERRVREGLESLAREGMLVSKTWTKRDLERRTVSSLTTLEGRVEGRLPIQRDQSQG